MIERRIKDLCIAREALSRFPGNEDQSRKLEIMVDELIEQHYKEKEPIIPYTSTAATSPNDEIPF